MRKLITKPELIKNSGTWYPVAIIHSVSWLNYWTNYNLFYDLWHNKSKVI